MDKFKDIDEYFLHLEHCQSQARIDFAKLSRINENELTDELIRRINYTYMNAHPLTLDVVKEHICSKLFDYINGFDLTLELDIVDLFMIIDAIKELKLHKEHNMSSDGNQFKKDIRKIKSNADQTFRLSTEKNLTIRLPNSSHSIVRLLLDYFNDRGILSVESIKNISNYFRSTRFGSTRRPRAGVKATELLYESYNKIGIEVMDSMRDGVDINTIYNNLHDENSIYNDEIKDIEYYSPKD